MQKGQTEVKVEEEESDAYSLFVYAIRSQVTKDYYLRRLRIFFNQINLLPGGRMEERCNLFATKGKEDPNLAFSYIVKFLQYQKERVEREEITGATLRNFVKAIKLFCEMSDVPISWKKINRGLPKIRRFADDRAPTLDEIQKISEYPDRRIKGIVYTMVSSGIRLGAWDYLRWKHIMGLMRNIEPPVPTTPGQDYLNKKDHTYLRSQPTPFLFFFRGFTTTLKTHSANLVDILVVRSAVRSVIYS